MSTPEYCQHCCLERAIHPIADSHPFEAQGPGPNAARDALAEKIMLARIAGGHWGGANFISEAFDLSNRWLAEKAKR